MNYKVFCDGIWDEIISHKGFTLFHNAGIDLYGDIFNWGNNKILNNDFKPDVIIATNPNMNAVKFGVKNNIPVIFYTLFPDQIVGWDFKKNNYLMSITDEFKEHISGANIVLTNSQYTTDLITKAWPKFSTLKSSVCYLGIDIKTINEIKTNLNDSNKKIRVIWNHMWRNDKGFSSALKILVNLALKNKNVEFIIGRKEDWDMRGDFGEKEAYSNFLKELSLRRIENIKITKILEVDEYWKTLKSIDIGFSTAVHETFGLGILDLEASKVACVAPNSEVYPEIHSGALLCDYENIEKSIQSLIDNKVLREQVSENGYLQSQKYNTEEFVSNLKEVILNLLKK